MMSPTIRAVLGCFVGYCVAWSANGAWAQTPSAGAAQPFFDWGLKLPARAVPRRLSHGGVTVPLGKPLVLANLDGPGCVRQLWMTGGFPGRNFTLRIFFDGADVPHVEAPLSDFFGVMHNLAGRGEAYRIDTPFLTVKPKNGFACHFPMPFAKSARIELTREALANEDPVNAILYALIDWHEYPQEPLVETQRFHARWRRESPVRDYADDFIVLDADGPGRLVGFVHSIDMLHSRQQMRWSHAGADNLYIDGEGEHPAMLRGIGGEDTFGTSFGGHEYQAGTSLFSDMPYYVQKDSEGDKQKLVGYRFFAQDAITFEKSLHIRFGSRAHDVATTSYWYSSAPPRRFYRLPPLEKRRHGSEVRRGEFDNPLPNCGQWRVAGPFPATQPITLPLAREVSFTKPFLDRQWKTYDSVRGFVEFNHLFRPEPSNKNSPTLTDVAAVASCRITSPQRTAATLTLGWDDHLTLRLNDEPSRELGHQPFLKAKSIPVTLNAGENSLSLRLTNTTGLTRGAWNFSFRCVTADGAILLPQP